MKKFFQEQVPARFGFGRLEGRPSHSCRRCERCEQDRQEMRREIRMCRLDLIDFRRELEQLRERQSGFQTPRGSFPPDVDLDNQPLLVPAVVAAPEPEAPPAVDNVPAPSQIRRALERIVGVSPVARYPTFYVPGIVPQPTPRPRRRHRGKLKRLHLQCDNICFLRSHQRGLCYFIFMLFKYIFSRSRAVG